MLKTIYNLFKSLFQSPKCESPIEAELPVVSEVQKKSTSTRRLSDEVPKATNPRIKRITKVNT